MNAAEKLLGLTLDGGFRVVKQLTGLPSSGGVFSVPYVVEDANGKAHFLKAFDFSDAFQPDKDVVKELQRMTAAYEHERDILEHCKNRRLSHVVTAITHGYAHIDGMPRSEGTVYYLIFELADSDVRRQVDVKLRLDPIWCLKVMDDVTLGLWQVHREAIAHQDTKPSNWPVPGLDDTDLSESGAALELHRA
jgi:serine/threonine protein kinase